MADNNKTKTNALIWNLEDAETFLKTLFKSFKPKTDAMTEEQKLEQIVKAITDFGKTDRKE
ncbi:MAG: hypothetical protein ACR2HX_20250 [Pyrinomonadaceae bacterium]